MIKIFYFQSQVQKFFENLDVPPLVIGCICFCLGIVTWHFFHLNWGWLDVVLVAVLLCSLVLTRHPQRATIAVGVLAYLLGAFSLAQANIVAVDSIARLTPAKKQMVTLKGTVSSELFLTADKSTFFLNVHEISQGIRRAKVSGGVFVRLKGRGLYAYGERLTMNGGLYQAPYRSGYRSSCPLFNVDGEKNVKRLGSDSHYAGMSLIYFLKRHIEKMIFLSAEPDTAGLLQALVLGEKDKVPALVRDSMICTGTWHIMVVSGSHTAFVALVLLMVFKVMRISRRMRFTLTIGLSILYCFLTGCSSPVVRSTVMTTVFLSGYLMERKPHFINSMCLACLVILIFDPEQLFNVGFQLSFMSVYFIVGLSPKIEKMFPESFFKKRILAYPLICFCVSLSAWLGTLPLLAYVFGNISLVTVLANMIVVPLATLVLAAGFSLVFIGAIHPMARVMMGKAVEFFMFLLLKINFIFASLPYTFFKIPHIPLAAVYAYYALIFLLFKFLDKSKADSLS